MVNHVSAAVGVARFSGCVLPLSSVQRAISFVGHFHSGSTIGKNVASHWVALNGSGFSFTSFAVAQLFPSSKLTSTFATAFSPARA